MTERFSIAVDDEHSVSAMLVAPERAIACFVFAPGAGAGMNHAFMETTAAGLAKRDIATLRYQFPYMEQGLKRPDRPPVCHATVRAAVKAASECLPSVPLVAGGKSFGGRMTSQAQAIEPLAGVHGLAFLGFPLHAAGQPSTSRADHLRDVTIPMLFLQGTRDRLATMALIESVVDAVGNHATLVQLAGADHSFHVTSKSGRTDSEVLGEMLAAFAAWVEPILARRRA